MSVTWDGKERRNNHECSQENRLERIEQVADVTQLKIAENTLATTEQGKTLIRIEEALKGRIEKYDAHVDAGEKFRFWLSTSFALAVVGGFAIAFSFGVWVSAIQEQNRRAIQDIQEVNNMLHQHLIQDEKHYAESKN